ncbi:sortase domain-containing protein [Prauserella cavernicola]|uniref:Class F sortase n=1 Tax=Prauserella cavernicola TaxID=2800127 RepID=A0A934QXN2_9PSEU|nr:sortase [Prauserella cavernicola]MBK1788403.1 class F sortase [Prauserella cavernicola]
MSVTVNTRDDAGRLGAVAAAVVVTLAAVLTTVTLARSQPADEALDHATPLGPGTLTDRGEVLDGPVPRAHDPLPASVPGSLHVPEIGLETDALAELGRTPTGVLEVPGTAATVGWLAENGTPGERGAAVLTGHTDFAYEHGAFYPLGDVRPGAEVSVGRADGTTAVFTVYRVQTVAHDAARALATAPSDHPDLRLLSVSGQFDSSAAEPDAVVVFARLTGVAR